MEQSKIPADLTSFVGRERECRELDERLGSSRLLTLVGPGGVGKTRLAKELARRDGKDAAEVIAFVELAMLTEGNQLVAAVARALGSDLSEGINSTAALADRLGDRQVLLVLDNCEHLISSCGRFASAVLQSCPGVTVMATSREPLGILGEQTWAVPPLSLPSEGHGRGDGDAVRLFVDRARSVSPEFDPTSERMEKIGELVRRLDGIPLAIELAAVRSRSFDVEQMLTEEVPIFQVLDRGNEGAPARHQTLRNAIAWSYDLCASEEQALWGRLAVFSGSFNLSAAREICGGEGLSRDSIVPMIGNLVEKSVVTCEVVDGAYRYRLLESLRVFGLERCDQPESWRRRHRDYYFQLAQDSSRTLAGEEQIDTVRRLQGELANIRSAVDYSLTRESERLLGLEMTGALWFYWNACGHLRDGCRWLRRALSENPEPSSARARALWVLGWYEMVQGDNRSARIHLEAARDMGESIGDVGAAAAAMQFLGTVEEIDGNSSAAFTLLEDAQRYHRESGEDGALSILCSAQLAMSHSLAGRVADARQVCDAALVKAHAQDERWAASWVEWNRGLCDHLLGDTTRSSASLRAALTAKSSLRDWLGAAACVELLAWNATEDHAMLRAGRLLGIGDMLCLAMGGKSPLFGSPALNGTRARYEERIRAAVGEDSFDQEFHAGQSMDLDQAVAFALSTEVDDRSSMAVRTERRVDCLLTGRELEISRLIYRGLSNREIAAELTISRRTVEGHVNRILAKLHFRSRSQVAVWFARNEALESSD
ncbi:LuxR C-terminal-related transcriptional regulator [Nocardioides endophyticus]|uniref:LuxR C-terminal-related transcriptional regulator n=1 Tax=Nocardioides endophyticus TaxID=1353775 RepID=A0ABP8ZNZ7_9ACTN